MTKSKVLQVHPTYIGGFKCQVVFFLNKGKCELQPNLENTIRMAIRERAQLAKRPCMAAVWNYYYDDITVHVFLGTTHLLMCVFCTCTFLLTSNHCGLWRGLHPRPTPLGFEVLPPGPLPLNIKPRATRHELYSLIEDWCCMIRKKYNSDQGYPCHQDKKKFLVLSLIKN